MQVWLSYASFEATPASMLGEEEQEEADSEADRRQAAAAQEGPAAAADREAHARRSACLPCTQNVTPTFALKLSCLMHHKWLHISDCQGLQLQYSYLHPPHPATLTTPLCQSEFRSLHCFVSSTWTCVQTPPVAISLS